MQICNYIFFLLELLSLALTTLQISLGVLIITIQVITHILFSHGTIDSSLLYMIKNRNTCLNLNIDFLSKDRLNQKLKLMVETSGIDLYSITLPHARGLWA